MAIFYVITGVYVLLTVMVVDYMHRVPLHPTRRKLANTLMALIGIGIAVLDALGVAILG